MWRSSMFWHVGGFVYTLRACVRAGVYGRLLMGIRRHRESGYTLLELLYVISIISLLGAMLIPQILTQREKVIMATAQRRLKSIGSVMADYSLSHEGGNYPNFEGLKSAKLISPGVTLSNLITDYSLEVTALSRHSEFGGPPRYTIIAYPRLERSFSGRLSTFAITEDNVVRVYRPGRDVNPEDPYTWEPIL